MAKNPLNKVVLTVNSAGIGAVTREMVHTRARELASLAGCAPAHVHQSDFEQAKRELTGEVDIDRQDAVLDSLPETNHARQVLSSTSPENLHHYQSLQLV